MTARDPDVPWPPEGSACHWDLYTAKGDKTGAAGVAILPVAVNHVQRELRATRVARYGQVQFGQRVYQCHRRGRGFAWSELASPDALTAAMRNVIPWQREPSEAQPG